MIARGEIDFSLYFAAPLVFRWMKAADHGARGCAYRVLRAVRARTDSHRQRPEGQKGRHRCLGRGQTPVCGRSWRQTSGSIPTRTSNGWRSPVGLTPWSCSPQGKIDAFLGFPPEPQELRARKIGHVIVNTTTDKPWSQYFCCMVAGTRSSSATIPSPPSASCEPFSRPTTSAPPSRSGPHSIWSMRGFAERYDYALSDADGDALRAVARVRPEDSLRFFALRLHEVGHDQVQPERADRRGHRLALPERAQARAEGVSQGRRVDRSARRLGNCREEVRCRSSSLAGIFWPAPVGRRRRRALGARASLADEGPPETTTIRIGKTRRHLSCASVRGR